MRAQLTSCTISLFNWVVTAGVRQSLVASSGLPFTISALRRARVFVLAAGFCFIIAGLPNSANAAECNCSTFTGSCTASASLTGQILEFRSSSAQCSMITYSVNGHPSAITIRGGSGSTDYLRTSTTRPQLSVDSCSICASGAATSNAGLLDQCGKQCIARMVGGFNACQPGPTRVACLTQHKQTNDACLTACEQRYPE